MHKQLGLLGIFSRLGIRAIDAGPVECSAATTLWRCAGSTRHDARSQYAHCTLRPAGAVADLQQGVLDPAGAAEPAGRNLYMFKHIPMPWHAWSQACVSTRHWLRKLQRALHAAPVHHRSWLGKACAPVAPLELLELPRLASSCMQFAQHVRLHAACRESLRVHHGRTSQTWLTGA